jgi:acyl dehydratase
MTFDVAKLKAWPFHDVETTYTSRETMLYALCIGAGRDPLDPVGLRYAYEKDLVALPTMAVVLGYPGSWMSDPATGIDYRKVVHGENALTVHQPLPTAGSVVGRTRVTRVVDKGPGKGAVVTAERTIIDRTSGALLATIEHVTFCRAEGGFSDTGGGADPPAPPLPRVPVRTPDAHDDLATRPDAALLYRLLADRNPLHADPHAARAAGFDRPILHGLATYGIAGLAIVRRWCDGEAVRLRSLRVRFTAPVFPGETLRTEMWAGDDRVHFRMRALERDVVVLDHGDATVAP